MGVKLSINRACIMASRIGRAFSRYGSLVEVVIEISSGNKVEMNNGEIVGWCPAISNIIGSSTS